MKTKASPDPDRPTVADATACADVIAILLRDGIALQVAGRGQPLQAPCVLLPGG